MKQAYPDCFKKLEYEEEELSTEWAEIKVFGLKNCGTPYREKWNDSEDYCTYKIVCKCKAGCPTGSESSSSRYDAASPEWGCEFEPPEEPANDNADDNYSYSDGNIKGYSLAPEAVIFTKGHWKKAKKLFGGLTFDEENTAEKLLKVSPFIIIPGGALAAKENDSAFKYLLEQYVNRGGNIIVFAQQYGDHIDKVVPVPEGESLKTYGWREDQSCLKNSIYFNSIHPVLSSSTGQLVDAGVDGYFAAYPSGSTILLRRRTNNEPAMLMYPYGNGYVILTTMFTDWAYSHSQASTAELNIIRDLVTFAKNPRDPMSMYNLADNPAPDINLTVRIKNKSTEQAAMALIKVYNPDRNRVLFETQQNISLASEQEMEIPIQFTLPSVTSSEMGICHTDYELYDSENNLIQMALESNPGRFAVYKVLKPYTPSTSYSVWITAKKDFFYWNEPADLELHIKNYSDEPIYLAP